MFFLNVWTLILHLSAVIYDAKWDHLAKILVLTIFVEFVYYLIVLLDWYSEIAMLFQNRFGFGPNILSVIILGCLCHVCGHLAQFLQNCHFCEKLMNLALKHENLVCLMLCLSDPFIMPWCKFWFCPSFVFGQMFMMNHVSFVEFKSILKNCLGSACYLLPCQFAISFWSYQLKQWLVRVLWV